MKKNLRWILLIVGIALFWLALEVNFFRLQVVRHDYFQKLAKDQYFRRLKLHAQRGFIYDWAGNRLVTNTIHYDLAADPSLVKNRKRLIRLCAEIFKKPESFFAAKLRDKSRFVYLERKVTAEEIQPILNLNDPGVIKIPVFRRSYLYGEYAAQLIGFTDPDDRGLGGLELQFNDLLKGKDGSAILQYSPGGRIFYNADFPIETPENGKDIYLTIDKNIQTVVEQALRRGVQNSRAASGMCVVMDPNSGRVLAMANFPSFDPNHQQDFKAFNKKNRIITDVFEPGSTIKSFVAATLLQTNLKKPGDLVYCENGRLRLYNKVFTDSRAHRWLTFKKVVSKSSNIGMIKLTQDLPANTLFRYLKSFGFGSETGIDLEGEEKGFLRQPGTWSKMQKASVSIGYGIGVTALQLATSYAALINGGRLFRPFVVWKITDPDGTVIEEHKPVLIRKVISQRVSNKIKEFLLSVVEEGTGTKAKIEGISLGGKTGTAKKVKPEGGYYSNRYLASFAGFAPFDEPKYVCVVIIDEPKTHFYGGQVAAPVFREIMFKIMNLDMPARMHKNDERSSKHEMLLVRKNRNVPDLTGFTREDAKQLLKAKDIDYDLRGKGDYVIRSYMKDDELIVELGDRPIQSEKMPRLTGLTLREAFTLIDLSKLQLKIVGDPTGIIYKQSLPPGTIVKNKARLVLTCSAP
ncbi:MAG: hypothetical protein GXO77_05965 [Calditrichaeota bacterium]|nr:hypothetical protein [Calditrichota bacterium]